MASKSATFEMNGKAYRTDDETLDVLRSVMPEAKRTGDMSAVITIMVLGEMTGRIVCDGVIQSGGK